LLCSSNDFFFKKEPSLFTWDGVEGFKIYDSFSDSDKLLKIWFSLFKMFKKEDFNSEFIVQCILQFQNTTSSNQVKLPKKYVKSTLKFYYEKKIISSQN
jgi:transposase-like protein